MSGWQRINEIAETSPELIAAGYQKIAQKCFPEGTDIFCPSCKFERHATTIECAEFCRTGLPNCKRCKCKTLFTAGHIGKR